MEYQILREDGKNILWLNGQFIGSVSDEVAERIRQAAQQSVQRVGDTCWCGARIRSDNTCMNGHRQ